MGSRLYKIIQQEHDIKFSKTYFYTDSMTVLYWINSETKRYKQFVANRLGEISELTNVKDWWWLPSNENVADEATRFGKNINFEKSSRWLTGPSFLYEEKENWPVKQIITGPEVKYLKGIDEIEEFNGNVTTKSLLSNVININEKFAWYQYVRIVAWILRYLQNLQNVIRNQPKLHHELTATEFWAANDWCIKISQQISFKEEYKTLSTGGFLHKSSKLFKLSPKLFDDGIIRIDGRLKNLPDCDYWLKHPAILDGKSEFGKKLIRQHHEQANHIGNEYVLNELRERYWLLSARTVLKGVRIKCNHCNILRAKPTGTSMGQLPNVRVASHVPAFTFTGVDYFEPIIVKVGRRTEKRYGVLFTCLTVRAVHIEIASSLSTDSCIMALRRFVSRRGSPQIIFSDNGTNFKGAERELLVSLQEFNHSKIQNMLTPHHVEWKFIPPSAPHMGGCWERLVRSIKTALYATLNTIHPSDETLHTFLVEAEQTVNSRPLILVSNDPDEPESLTPNHFLLGRSSASAPIGKFDDKDLMLRKQWRAAMVLTDHFWRRWRKEYLPSLNTRSKWFQSEDKLKINDIVYIADNNLPRGNWPRGIVTKVYPGKDMVKLGLRT